MTGGEVLQRVPALLAAGRHHRQHPLHERAPRAALGPATESYARSPHAATHAPPRCSSGPRPQHAGTSRGVPRLPAVRGRSPPSWRTSTPPRAAGPDAPPIATGRCIPSTSSAPWSRRAPDATSGTACSECSSSLRPTSAASPPRSIIAWKSRRRCASRTAAPRSSRSWGYSSERKKSYAKPRLSDRRGVPARFSACESGHLATARGGRKLKFSAMPAQQAKTQSWSSMPVQSRHHGLACNFARSEE